MIEEIQKHFEKEYPREGCGLILIVKGKKKWFPCENLAKTEDNFILSSKDWFKAKQMGDIFAVVHSHPDDTNEPSQYDIDCCNAIGLPYYIFSYPEMELNVLEPKKHFSPLIGREYAFGTADCFEAMRDWLASKNINIPPRAAFEDYWWDKELNYFTEETISQWGFRKVEDAQVNDLLIFQASEKVPDHCGVYIGNDMFFHHCENRLSCRDSLYPFWHSKIVGIYRHEA